jgi:CheY-like chemotaxis protein
LPFKGILAIGDETLTDILIVEDESIVGMNTEFFLKEAGYNVLGVIQSGEEALKFLEIVKPDLVIMDIVLHGDLSGTETTRIINEKYDLPVVYMTAHSDTASQKEISRTVHSGVLLKPFDINQLKELIEGIVSDN